MKADVEVTWLWYYIEYLFQTLFFLVYSISWQKTNNLPINIDKNSQQRDILSNSIFISNNPLVKTKIQDIVNANSAKAIQMSFNTLFDIKNIANFYIIGSSSFLACDHSKKCKNLIIKDSINQLSDDLVLAQK